MKFWDNPAAKAMTLWTVAVAACILVAIMTMRCAPDPVAPSTPCLPDIIALENESATCTEAQIKVDILLRYSDTCRSVYRDGGFDVCGKIRKDGGRDGTTDR